MTRAGAVADNLDIIVAKVKANGSLEFVTAVALIVGNPIENANIIVFKGIAVSVDDGCDGALGECSLDLAGIETRDKVPFGDLDA